MKKEWNAPVVDELDMKETAGGGMKPSVHDGNVYEMENGIWVEEYEPEESAS